MTNKVITLRISKRPSSILSDNRYFAASGSAEKLANELIFPNPGPTFPMDVIDAVKAVIPSIFIAARINVTTKDKNIEDDESHGLKFQFFGNNIVVHFGYVDALRVLNKFNPPFQRYEKEINPVEFNAAAC